MPGTYDGRANSAHIYLSVPGEAATTCVCDLQEEAFELAARVHLNFDGSSRLIGFEVLHAGHGLPREILNQYEVIGWDRERT